MTDLAYDGTPQAAHEDECPSWCCGCDERTGQHATEFEGPGSYPADGGAWHAIARTVLGHHRGGPALIEISVQDQDGSETAVRLTPDQAAELAAAISYSTDCAQESPEPGKEA